MYVPAFSVVRGNVTVAAAEHDLARRGRSERLGERERRRVDACRKSGADDRSALRRRDGSRHARVRRQLLEHDPLQGR